MSFELFLHREQGILRRAALEFVGLGQQHVQRQLALQGPVDHLPVELFKRVANVAEQDQAAQRLPPPQVFL